MNAVTIFSVLLLAVSACSDLIIVKNRRKILCSFFFCGSVLLIGLRSVYTAGTDTLTVYEPLFHNLANQSLADVCSRFLFRDPLFYIFTKLFSMTTLGYQIYLFVIALFVAGSISYFVYKYSAYPLLSFALFMMLQYYGFEFQMIKHSIAFSILLFSYPYLLERQFRSFAVIVVLAGLFHISAFVFFFAYLVSRFKVHVMHLVVFIFAAFAIFIFRDAILELLRFVFQSQRFDMYFLDSYTGRLPITGFFIATTVFLLSFIIIDKKYKDTNEFTTLFNLSFISCLILLGVTIFGESVRVSMFFGIGNLLLLPYAIRNSSIAYKKMLVYVISFVGVSHFILFGMGNAGLENYIFFWQDPSW